MSSVLCRAVFALVLCCVAFSARATEADIYCLAGAKWTPCPSAASPVTSTNVSTTITVTNTFQSLQAASTTRKGCLIQNGGSNNMWVFFGPIASATKALSFLIVPVGNAGDNSISCATGTGGVLGDQVSITGTSGDAFTANFQ